MQRARSELESKTLSEVADWMYEQYDNPAVQVAGQAEFMRRQTLAQQDAAHAAVRTAGYTARNARYMLWSVIALAASSLISLFVR